MKYLEPKKPTDTKFYAIDYSKMFSPDNIGTITANVLSGTVKIDKKVYNNTAVGLMISGGVEGESASISLQISTVAGQIYNDTIVLLVSSASDIDFTVVTKGQVIEFTYEDLRLSGYIFDHTADENQAMLKRLDALMRMFRLQKRDIGYNHPSSIGGSDYADIAGFDDGLATSVATILADAMIQGMGKSYTPNFIKKLNAANNYVYVYAAQNPERVIPVTTPVGAGNKFYNAQLPFFPRRFNSDKGTLLQGFAGQFYAASVYDQAIWN
jgi:hypothetical protein